MDISGFSDICKLKENTSLSSLFNISRFSDHINTSLRSVLNWTCTYQYTHHFIFATCNNLQFITNMSFKLSATLSGHEQDVRGVVAPSNSVIISGLRDATVRIWTPIGSSGCWGSSLSEPLIAFHSPTNSFINSITYVDSESEPLIAAGGQDSMIYLCDVALSDRKPEDDVGKYQLIGHSGNVCSLSSKDNQIISGSWDTTAKVWDLDTFSVKYDLVGHESSVWDAQILDSNRFITCSADRTIRVWEGSKEISRFTGHNDVIRKLLLLPGDQFASASNDGTIKIWDLKTGKVQSTLVGHDSFVYDLKLLSNGDIVSTGEDRTVRVWRDGKILQVITLPCISVWCVDVLDNDDFVVGSSDNFVRIFSRDSSRYSSEDELKQFAESVKQSTISEQSLDNLKKTDIPGIEALQKPGKQEGATIMVKTPEGVIEAHQWSGGDWIKIGDVVGSAAPDLKKEFNGKEWDYVFDVDIEDGAPPLKLPYNLNENLYLAAERFLSMNELPSSYIEEVVKFIGKNTEGFQLLEQTEPIVNPYADKHPLKAPAPATALEVLPQQAYIQFKDFKAEQLIKGLTKFNADQDEANKFSTSELAQVNYHLSALNSKEAVELISKYIPKIIKNWKPETRMIGFDLLRVSIPRLTTVDVIRSTDIAEVVYGSIDSGIDIVTASTLPLLMLLLKTINNLLDTVLFVQLFIDPTAEGKSYEYNQFFKDLLSKIGEKINAIVSSPGATENKHYQSTINTLATLVYNLSAMQVKTQQLRSNPGSSSSIVDFSTKLGKIIVESNSEAAYRLAIAFGNFRYVKEIKETPAWVENVRTLYGREKRFIDLAGDIESL